MKRGSDDPIGAPPARMRVDKWLWQARFFRSRGLAAALATSGRLRVNGMHSAQAARLVGPGDVLTFPQGRRIRVIRVEAIGTRRGPAAEARLLYTDLTAPPEGTTPAPAGEGLVGERPEGAGRPEKRERRQIERLGRGNS